MIQRIQTVYLILIAGIMLAILLLSPLSIPMYSICGITALLALITIFNYKKRPLQIKLCYLVLGLIIASYAVSFIAYGLPTTASFSNINSIVAIASPLLAIIFDLLAIKGIKKDHKLVNSLNRLR